MADKEIKPGIKSSETYVAAAAIAAMSQTNLTIVQIVMIGLVAMSIVWSRAWLKVKSAEKQTPKQEQKEG